MTARRTLAALLVATVLSTTGVILGLAVEPAAAAPTSAASLVVAPDGGGVVASGKSLGVTVTVTDTGTAALPAGRIALSLEDAPVASTTTLLSSIARPEAVLLGRLTRATATVPPLTAGTSATVRTTIAKDDLDSILTSASGARLLYARYRPDGSTVQTVAESSVVRIASGSKASVGLSTVIPVLAPAGTTGVVDVATQQQLTAPDGAWSTALRAAQSDPSAAVALDPAVLASIRIAGAAAPPEASSFLARLGALPNEFLRLPYADGDVTLEHAAGVSASSLEPTSFAGVPIASRAGSGPTPAPTATPRQQSASAGDLTAWNWSKRDVTWPVTGTTSGAALAALGRTGQVLLSSGDLQDSVTRRAAGPLARIGSTRVLVSDANSSSLLAAASAGGTAGEAALATLTGALATAAVTGETTGVLATIGRSTDPAHLDRVLALLQRQTWIRSVALSDLGDGRSAPAVALHSGAVPGLRVATAKSLLSGEDRVQDLGKAILTGADAVTAPQHLALLGAFSSAWHADTARWSTAATSVQQSFTHVLSLVQLVKQSPPRLIGNDGKIPVGVENGLTEPVRVVVHAGVSNGAVQFTDPTATIIVPAGGRASAKLAFRSIRNGRTDLTLALTTPAGVPLGSELVPGATVQAGFDTIVAVALLCALGLLLALGVYRNVRRRRQPRTATS
ncbi:MAG: hypothetical protein HIU86_03965 [Acidobacteria bacterium]|nr:hypothetical protein [Acidobacteriota bacterium]